MKVVYKALCEIDTFMYVWKSMIKFSKSLWNVDFVEEK